MINNLLSYELNKENNKSLAEKNNDFLISKTKVSFKCPIEYKLDFLSSTCSLTISVGQDYHEDDKLIATIKKVNNSFRQCNIMVCDSLQRHTMAIKSNLSPDYFYDYSIKEGSRWIERNKLIIDCLEIPFVIVRWDYWLNHPDFNLYKEKVLFHYNSNQSFKKAMHMTIDDFFTRLKKRNTEIDYKRVFKLSFDYLIEECTAQLLWVPYNYHFEIYPAERNPILQCCYEHFIKEYFPNILRPISLKYKKSLPSTIMA